VICVYDWENNVGGLKVLRESQDYFHQEETRLLRAASVQESIHDWLRLQASFEWQLQQTADLFEQDRWKALSELQSRLKLLID